MLQVALVGEGFHRHVVVEVEQYDMDWTQVWMEYHLNGNAFVDGFEVGYTLGDAMVRCVTHTDLEVPSYATQAIGQRIQLNGTMVKGRATLSLPIHFRYPPLSVCVRGWVRLRCNSSLSS